MANYHSSLLLLAVATAGLAGCTTSVSSDDPVPPSQTEISKIYLQVEQNEYTRAGETENDINTLYLAFYSSNEGTLSLKFLKEATKEESQSGKFFVELNLTPGDYPDKVVAFANISDETAMRNAISSTSSKLTDLGIFGNLAMSSTRYFDENGTDIYYTSLTSKNFTSNNVVSITLEKVAAKVTLSKADGLTSTYTAGDKILTLVLDNWSVNATDKGSYLIKQIGTSGISAFSAGLEGWTQSEWNNSTGKTMHWAHSENYNKDASDFPGYSDNLSTAITSHVLYSAISTKFNSAVYTHETTRPASLFETPNALPAVVIAGHYLINDSQLPVTFYRYGSQILTEVEYWNSMANAQEAIYKSGGASKPDGTELKEILSDKTPANDITGTQIANNLVTPQAASIEKLNGYCNSDGTAFNESNLNDLNKQLYTTCRLMEKFIDGNCVFSIPIKHMGEDGKEGAYGLVRNHHYNMSIKSISGIGTGVADVSLPISDQPESSVSDSYKIIFSITVNDWTEVSQEIEIKEQ